MFGSFLVSIGAMVQGFVLAPVSLLTGTVSPLTLVGTAGLALLVVGLLLLAIRPEKQATWLLPPLVLALISPAALGLARAMMGWFGLLFALAIGIGGLLLWIGFVANDANRRLPFWLAGLGGVGFTAYSGLIAILLVWGVG